MRKLVFRGYITEGVILVLTSFFSVTRLTGGILTVFDATVNGLNDSMWDPECMFLSMGSLIMIVGPETHMVNIYVG